MGHLPVNRRLNLRAEIKRIKEDPLKRYLAAAYPKTELGGTRSKYEDAYYLYTKAMERALEQVSVLVRYRKGPHYVRKYGGSYGPRQKQLAEKWRKLHPFTGLDINTCILQTRILLDRTIGLSRAFLSGSRLPSFTSFNDHKKFFVRNPNALSRHKEYARYIVNKTDWFDTPLKVIRDKFIVHSGPKHVKALSIGWESDDLSLDVFILEPKMSKSVDINIWRLSYDIESFLKWFAKYGLLSMNKK